MVLQPQHIAGDCRGHVGVAVAVAADPGAEGQRMCVRRQGRAVAGELRGQIGDEVRQRLVDEVLQVVDDVTSLVDRRRLVRAQLIGLPDQVDDLGEIAVLPGPAWRCSVRSGLRGCRPRAAASSGPTGGWPRSDAR